jgi:antitoxin VapB
MEKARLFWSGRSQAVRLPKAFRFNGDQVRIRRHGTAVILEPLPKSWDWLDDIAGKFDDEFIEAVNEKPPEQERPELDRLFR